MSKPHPLEVWLTNRHRVIEGFLIHGQSWQEIHSFDPRSVAPPTPDNGGVALDEKVQTESYRFNCDVIRVRLPRQGTEIATLKVTCNGDEVVELRPLLQHELTSYENRAFRG